MNCLPCFGSKEENVDTSAVKEDSPEGQPTNTPPPATEPPSKDCTNERASSIGSDDNDEPIDVDEGGTTAKAYTFRELASATKNFRQECLIGECGFGRIYRGTLQSSGQVVLVRQLDRSATLESKEFQVEVLKLSLLQHPNLVRLIGYCADGEQRLLVYEYMPSGHVDKHLFDIPADKKPLKWSARMKIASGIAQGLEYLHEKANPPVIYRELKSSSIMLDETNNPRLSDYGLLKLMQNGSKMHLSPQVTASGYCAPEFERDGESTVKSDVYSFGVVLLGLISGRRALDPTLPADDQSLVAWAQPIFRDPKRFPDMADPLLKGEYSVTSLNQAVGVAAMCLQEEPMVRPMISDIVAALSFLAVATPDMPIPTGLAPMLSGRVDTLSHHVNRPSSGSRSASTDKNEDSSDSEDEENRHSDDEDEQEDEDENENSKKSITKIKESGEWTVNLSGKSKADKCSSFGSTPSSAGFSLRCDSTYPERDLHAKQEVIHESHHFHSSSSSDEESGYKSSSQVRRLESRKSKKKMSKKRQNSSISKSSVSSHSRNENLMESDDDDDDDSDFVYSRHSSSVGSDYELDDNNIPEHED